MRFTTANMDFVRDSNRLYLAHLCKGSDVLAVQEAKDIRLEDVLPPYWATSQDLSSPDRAGSAICWDTRTAKARRDHLWLGVRPYIDGHRVGMETRWIAVERLTCDGLTIRNISAHLPPERFDALQPAYVRHLHAVTSRRLAPPAVAGVDANMPIHELGRKLNLAAVGIGIVGVLFDDRKLVASNPVIDHWGQRHDATDHPAITVTIHKK